MHNHKLTHQQLNHYRQTISKLWAIILISENLDADDYERVEVVNKWLTEVLKELTEINITLSEWDKDGEE